MELYIKWCRWRQWVFGSGAWAICESGISCGWASETQKPSGLSSALLSDPKSTDSNAVILAPQIPDPLAGRLLTGVAYSFHSSNSISDTPGRPHDLASGDPMKWRAPQALITQKSPWLLLSPPLNNVTNGCLRAEVWSKQSLNYNKVSHSAALIA